VRHQQFAQPAGNPNVLVCERGTMFGYSDLVVDPRNFVLMRDAGCPVTADVTHALQQPAGGGTGQHTVSATEACCM
jgi:3-deoxy-D-manno-octulosonic acid (KDO) 8-phosphate synthase